MTMCPNCHVPNVDTATVCANCGASLFRWTDKKSAFDTHEIGLLLSYFDRCHLFYPEAFKRGVGLLGLEKMPDGHELPQFFADEITLAYITSAFERIPPGVCLEKVIVGENTWHLHLLVTNHRFLFLEVDSTKTIGLHYSYFNGVNREFGTTNTKLILGIPTLMGAKYSLHFRTPNNLYFLKAMAELCSRAFTRNWD